MVQIMKIPLCRIFSNSIQLKESTSKGLPAQACKGVAFKMKTFTTFWNGALYCGGKYIHI
jgi:hypothetical protein